nr:leucyl/phenylalanyl-tRNA--protein transferase [Blastocatellia bacterium]
YAFPQWVHHGEFVYYGRDVVSFGDELTVANVRQAYENGIFPWNMDGIPLPWYCPERRAVLMFDELRVPRSLQKVRRQSPYTFSIDRDFPGVMEECSHTIRPDQAGTWISPEFIEVYTELHQQGMAHSVEAWAPDGTLAGGLYGVDAGGVFCGESMFFRQPNASKLALLHLIDHLRSRGSTWLDAQVMTPHMKALGAREIPRSDFLKRLVDTQQQNLELF